MSPDYGKKPPFLELLLLQCGDVELNPGPPRRNVAAAAPKKTETKEEKEESLTSKVFKFFLHLIIHRLD